MSLITFIKFHPTPPAPSAAAAVAAASHFFLAAAFISCRNYKCFSLTLSHSSGAKS
jgi:hypothetical protein